MNQRSHCMTPLHAHDRHFDSGQELDQDPYSMVQQNARVDAELGLSADEDVEAGQPEQSLDADWEVVLYNSLTGEQRQHIRRLGDVRNTPGNLPLAMSSMIRETGGEGRPARDSESDNDHLPERWTRFREKQGQAYRAEERAIGRGIITSLVDPLRIIRGRKFTIWERNVDLEMMDIWVLWS
ncbi:predicted protein [Plenodomus lingam JN3]|uniref:Predicted protein n=1 Tax=Leptosphaeria maculans (strain JN3 / isolate v23.1.3 / race Av1-4-5-6-7-8) TaxID=985895 RepID=E4ZK81_LEPMJ|nr:predicted protein [Plenodomus lingam JN3]CBX91676.1 predicted protein [Plenodomus lingam JN3]